MFNIRRDDDGSVHMDGRFDASRVAQAKEIFDSVSETCIVDLAGLDYISSAGLGILLATQKRLQDSGHGLRLVNMNGHIRNIFTIAGFDLVFEIQ